jgi:hypothetical protein
MSLKGLLKGTSFEMELGKYIKGDSFRLFSNVSIYSYKLRKYTEIDNLVITPWRLYSVESKSFSSYLKGEIGDYQWLGITGRTTTPVYNPVMQNFEHIRSLNSSYFRKYNEFLDVENYVVIPDTCKGISNYSKLKNISDFLDELSWHGQVYDHRNNLNDITEKIGGLFYVKA